MDSETENGAIVAIAKQAAEQRKAHSEIQRQAKERLSENGKGSEDKYRAAYDAWIKETQDLQVRMCGCQSTDH